MMEDFDKLWNYSDVAATETVFKERLATGADKDISYLLQLQTQIARTYSLRGMFTEAHHVLDAVEKQLSGTAGIEHARYHLERGRTYTSSSKAAEAKIHFELAKSVAEKLKAEFYLIDAIHMLAIIAPPAQSIILHQEGIVAAENSADEGARNWFGSLYNNLGWTYFDAGEYEKALSIFLRALQWRETKNSALEIFLAKWCIARTLRALNRTEDALKIQLALFEESTTTGSPDGYVHEELAELFLLKNDRLKFPFHFEKAYELLSAEEFLHRNEPARLERMKRLAGV
jgi:tetratricopeptide (TPR) repeat protein